MSIMDRFLGMMNLNPEDDDYYDDFDYDDDEPKEPKGPLLKRPKAESSQSRRKSSSHVKRQSAQKSTKIMPLKGSKNKQAGEEMEVCIIRPNTIEDVREITDTLLHDRTVILNMEGVNLDIAQRIIDFTSGSCFAMGGNLQKVSNFIFIITPPNVEISGDIQEFIGGLDDSPIQTDL